VTDPSKLSGWNLLRVYTGYHEIWGELIENIRSRVAQGLGGLAAVCDLQAKEHRLVLYYLTSINTYAARQSFISHPRFAGLSSSDLQYRSINYGCPAGIAFRVTIFDVDNQALASSLSTKNYLGSCSQ